MPEIERDGEELPRLSPGVGCDSTAQGDKVSLDERDSPSKLRVSTPEQSLPTPAKTSLREEL